jgi:ABC-2 type transport system permease protein
MKNIIQKTRLLLTVATVTYKEWAAYRAHSLLSIFIGPAYFLVMSSVWSALYSNAGSLNNMSLNQVITYYGITTLINYATMDFAGWNFQMLIRTGKYLTFALRPVHHRFFALSQKIGHRTLGIIFEFIPVLLIFIFIFKINIMPYNLLYAVISIILCFLMNFYVNYSIGLLAFWFTDVNGLSMFYRLLSSLFSGALLPLTFFPIAIQKIMFFLPFQYIYYIPSMVYTGNVHMAGLEFSIPAILSIQALYVIIMFFASDILYRAGIKHFTGVGT